MTVNWQRARRTKPLILGRRWTRFDPDADRPTDIQAQCVREFDWILWHLPTTRLYCGEEWDPDLGMYYLRARYLNPNTGRFWGMDKQEGNKNESKSRHLYNYCQEDPVNGVDPSGQIKVECLTGKPPYTTVSGSMHLEFKFTLDSTPTEDGFIVQRMESEQDNTTGREKLGYFEAWFIPAGSPDAGGPPSVRDSWDRNSSTAVKGTGFVHSKLKYFTKKTTLDLGDYRHPPAKPDPKTGWHPGNGKDNSIDLPWIELEKEPAWWKSPSENGEKDAEVSADTDWKYTSSRIPMCLSENLNVSFGTLTQ